MAVVIPSNQRWRVWAVHLALLAFIAITMLPLLTILSISLRPGNFAGGSLIPKALTLDHWKLALGISVLGPDGKWEAPPFPVLQWIANSMKVALVSAAVALLLSVTSAYAFARMRFRGKRFTLDALLLLQMFPSVLALVAIYAIFDRIGEWVPWLGLNSHWSLVLAYSGGIAQRSSDYLFLLGEFVDDVQVGFQTGHGGVGYQVVDSGNMLLAVAVDAAVTLLQRDERPGNVVVKHSMAVVVQVHALRAGIGAEQQPDTAVLLAEVFDDLLLLYIAEAAVELRNGAISQTEILA